MRLLVGYNITDRAYAYMKEKEFKGLERVVLSLIV